MIFNILSTAIWLVAQSFSLFLLARIVAGLSEGNIQLSIAIISDVTSPESRSKNMVKQEGSTVGNSLTWCACVCIGIGGYCVCYSVYFGATSGGVVCID